MRHKPTINKAEFILNSLWLKDGSSAVTCLPVCYQCVQIGYINPEISHAPESQAQAVHNLQGFEVDE